eukprot:TRINITY_DN12816_c0_g1_i1.p2 TRINITY_DN12816_c0_g1~~TRINITY_DN12816_c0_g1_i1.p2  ORF type:complete len:339 (+),score=74.85 TRINITY_DN12816_c0_g1_i1:60-1076(+)
MGLKLQLRRALGAAIAAAVWLEPVVCFGARVGMTALGTACVAGAQVLILTLSFTWWRSILPAIFDPWSVAGVVNLIVSACLTFNVCFNHFMAAAVSPGFPQCELLPTAPAQQEDLCRRPGEQWARFCRRCAQWKPPRAHHCPFCGSCVLKMDHHCPWINNCVGHCNHKWFFSMLLYIWLATGQIAGVIALYWTGRIGDPASPQMNAGLRAVINMEFTLCAALCFMMTLFCGWNGYLLISNQTAIEFYGNRQSMREARAAGRTWRNPYDLGVISNLQEVYGFNLSVAWMLVPSLQPAPTDGHSHHSVFGTVSISEQCAQEEEYESDSEMRVLPKQHVHV